MSGNVNGRCGVSGYDNGDDGSECGHDNGEGRVTLVVQQSHIMAVLLRKTVKGDIV